MSLKDKISKTSGGSAPTLSTAETDLSLIKFNLHGFGTRIDAVEFLAEFVAEFSSLYVPIMKRNGADFIGWRQVLIDSLLKYIAKKGVNTVLSMLVPKNILGNIQGIKYIGDGILNVIVGVLARYVITWLEISTIPFDTFWNESIEEAKTEIIKQIELMAYDALL